MASVKPITRETYSKLVTSWLKFAQFHEIGYFVSSPGSAPDRRILQFLADKDLQSKLIAKQDKTLLLYLDFQQNPDVSEEDVRIRLRESFQNVTHREIEPNNLAETMHTLEDEGYVLYVFITGIDSFLVNHKYTAIKELYSMYEKVRNISLLFFTTAYIDKQPQEEILQKHVSSTNVYYKPLYSREDSEQFISFLENYWSITVSSEHKTWIVDECGGKLGLIKTALRILRDNPKIGIEELRAHPSLQERATYILNSLNHDAKEVLRRVSKTHTLVHNENPNIVNYLINIGFLLKENNAYSIRPKYLEHFLFHQKDEQSFYDLPTKEYAVLQCLLDKKDTVVARDQIAQCLWAADWEDKYSDWAIDQAIHRLRQKLRETGSPYSITTKKGVGFMLKSQG